MTDPLNIEKMQPEIDLIIEKHFSDIYTNFEGIALKKKKII